MIVSLSVMPDLPMFFGRSISLEEVALYQVELHCDNGQWTLRHMLLSILGGRKNK